MVNQLIVEIAFLKVDSFEKAVDTLKTEILNVLQQAGLSVAQQSHVSASSGTHFTFFLEPETHVTLRAWTKLNRASIDIVFLDDEKLVAIRENLEVSFTKAFASSTFRSVILPRGIDLIALNDNKESIVIFKNPEILAKEQTPFQKLVVLDTHTYLGKCLTLDERTQIASGPIDNYTPGLADPVLAGLESLGKPGKLLIIGGGDGRVMRYFLQKDASKKLIDYIDMVEIDQKVIDVCEKHFDDISTWRNDPRAHLLIQDAVKWVAQEDKVEYDGVVVDCTDVDVAPSLQLFGITFYRQLMSKLRTGAVFTQQCDVDMAYAHQTHAKLVEAGWKKVAVVRVSTPEYMGDTFVCTAEK
jgi:spermidine synthase